MKTIILSFITALFCAILLLWSYNKIRLLNKTVEEQHKIIIQDIEIISSYDKNSKYKDTIISLLKEINYNLNEELKKIN